MIKNNEYFDQSCSDCLSLCDNLTRVRSKLYDKIPESYLCNDCLSLLDNIVDWRHWIAEPVPEVLKLNKFKKRNLTGVAKSDPDYNRVYIQKKEEAGLKRVNWFIKSDDIEYLQDIMKDNQFTRIDQAISFVVKKVKRKKKIDKEI